MGLTCWIFLPGLYKSAAAQRCTTSITHGSTTISGVAIASLVLTTRPRTYKPEPVFLYTRPESTPSVYQRTVRIATARILKT